MFYDVYRLSFPYGVHFGNRYLEKSNMTFCADTLFSALCIEALKNGNDDLEYLYNITKNNELLLSDAFPYLKDEFFMPKPYISIDSDNDSSLKKQYKKMNYVASSKWKDYLVGELNPYEEVDKEKNIGKYTVSTSASIRGNENSLPYRIGKYIFSKDAGLYIIYGYENDNIRDFFFKLLDGLSFSGIGGRRSSGLGRFNIYNGKMPKVLEDGINKESDKYITLSVSLPCEEELANCIEGSSYMLNKRSGFVESDNYADNYLRKKDLYMFSSGSCFTSKYKGDIYDVSSGGNHPVFKYGKPIFMGV